MHQKKTMEPAVSILGILFFSVLVFYILGINNKAHIKMLKIISIPLLFSIWIIILFIWDLICHYLKKEKKYFQYGLLVLILFFIYAIYRILYYK